MQIFQLAKYTIKGIVLLLLLSSCSTKKFLVEEEMLLKGNSVKFESPEKIKKKSKLQYELSNLYRQKENGKFLGLFPREWFYYNTNDPGDTTKFDKLQKKMMAQAPAIYKDSATYETVDAMTNMLRYKGFLNGEVFHTKKTKEKQKKVFVTYHIKSGTQFTIDSVFFHSKDQKLQQVLNDLESRTFLKRGTELDLTIYEQEKDRIATHLRNNGYADFTSYYFAPLEIDTFQTSKKGNLYLSIGPPVGDSLHQVFRVGKVVIYPDYDPTADSLYRDTLIHNYIFRLKNKEMDIDPLALIRVIQLKQGEIYSQANYDLTNIRLASLGVFKFIRIKPENDEVGDLINFRLELTPNLKIETRTDFDFNYTNRSSTSGTGNLIGVSLSPSITNRNFLGGAELFVTDLSAGVEMNIRRNTKFWNTIDIRLQNDLVLPRFNDYLGIWKKVSKLKKEEKRKAYLADATTKVSASYNYLLILEWYRYQLFNASFGYDFQHPDTRSRLIIHHIGIDYLNPVFEENFKDLFAINPYLERSFGKQLFVSLLFRDLTFSKRSKTNQFGENNYLGINAEMAGMEMWVANSIYNKFALNSDTLSIGKDEGEVNFSQYVKFEFDARYFRKYTPRRSFAARINIGAATPFGYSTDVPYVKQFYAGGPSSIRAWAPRGLGPGGYQDSLSLDKSNNSKLYQTGDIKLEFNLEYRFDFLWRIKGAIFLDGGNVWTLKYDDTRCGSQFLFSAKENPKCQGDEVNDPFYKQIALGTGFGLRFDFTYFIFRLDLATKLRNSFPATRTETGMAKGKEYWADFSGWGLKDIAFNIGFGYPF